MTAAPQFFYVGGKSIHPGTYLGLAYYGLPFMLISSGFGGYTAYAISKKPELRSFYMIYGPK